MNRCDQATFTASAVMIGAVALILILLVASIPKVPVTQTGASAQLVEYCFSPGGNCADVIVRWVDHANVSLHVLIYSFALDSLGDAVIRAKNRGLSVQVVIEKDNRNIKGSEWSRLKENGVDIRLDGNSADMHDKIAIIDSIIVITGSFNWSQNANERNNENLVVLRDQSWAQAFESQFTAIWNKASA